MRGGGDICEATARGVAGAVVACACGALAATLLAGSPTLLFLAGGWLGAEMLGRAARRI